VVLRLLGIKKWAAIKYLEMIPENTTDVCLSLENDTAQNLQTFWQCRGMGEPLPDPAPLLP
jgi:hypothetical protein